jgi:SAM-dependent methyltransferase
LPDMTHFHYVGSELEIFAHANNWKSYVHSKLRSYLVGDVLEVGAGIGAATRLFNDGAQRRWVCLEPDPMLAVRIKNSSLPHVQNCEVFAGALADLNVKEKFDAILYMDVLEHIKDDAAELALAAQHLKTNGALLVLAPALPWLYTPFDAAIGHYRRYTRNSLRSIAPQGLREEKCMYLDAFGMLASVGNRLLLRTAAPCLSQIRFWDSLLVPISRFVDGALAFSLGRSVLAVWRKAF